MHALVFDGQLHVVADCPQPCAASGEALIRVVGAGICATDLEIVDGYMGFKGVVGHEFVGIVEQGPEKLIGKRVVGEINCVCHRCDMCVSGREHHCRDRTVLGIKGRNGAFAEYITLPVENLHVLPDGVSNDQAVFVEPLAAAFEILEQIELAGNEQMAVLGAGRLGLLVAQVLKPRVSALRLFASSLAKADLCNAVGLTLERSADIEKDYEADVVIDCTGRPQGFNLAQRITRPTGTIVLKSTYAGDAGPNPAIAVINELTIIGSRCGPFEPAIDALASGQVNVEPMISARFDLEHGIEAFERAGLSDVMKIVFDIS